METKAELEAGFVKKCLLITTLKGIKKSIIAASRFVVL